jgi:hypothetical protein
VRCGSGLCRIIYSALLLYQTFKIPEEVKGRCTDNDYSEHADVEREWEEEEHPAVGPLLPASLTSTTMSALTSPSPSMSENDPAVGESIGCIISISKYALATVRPSDTGRAGQGLGRSPPTVHPRRGSRPAPEPRRHVRARAQAAQGRRCTRAYAGRADQGRQGRGAASGRPRPVLRRCVTATCHCRACIAHG